MWHKPLFALCVLSCLLHATQGHLQFSETYLGYTLFVFGPESGLSSCNAALFVGQESSYSMLASRLADDHDHLFVTIALADSEPTHTFEQVALGVKSHLREWLAAHWSATMCSNGIKKWIVGGHGEGASKVHGLVLQYGKNLADAEFVFDLTAIETCTSPDRTSIPLVVWQLESRECNGLASAKSTITYKLKTCDHFGTPKFHSESLSNDGNTNGYLVPTVHDKVAVSMDRLFEALYEPKRWLSAFFEFNMPWAERCGMASQVVLSVSAAIRV